MKRAWHGGMPPSSDAAIETLSREEAAPQNGKRPSAYLVLVFQGQEPLEPSVRIALDRLEEVALGRSAGPERSISLDGTSTVTVSVWDRLMSGTHGRFFRRAGAWFYEDAESKNGSRVNSASVTEARLTHGDLIEVGDTMFMYTERASSGQTDPPAVYARPAEADVSSLHTLNLELAAHFDELGRVARRPVPILIQGETGTGKEVAARAIHRMSGRAGEIVAVNCGALPPSLIESELFGHVRGAFSGAIDDKCGLVRRAEHGTLFLDEVAELSTSSQVALLRVLQEHEVRPVGSQSAVPVNVRVVAATHQNLEELVDRGAFREDLFARLAGFVASLPALRERREDLGTLIGSVLRRVAGEEATSVRFTNNAMRALFLCRFPLNIRELEHALASAVALADGREIELCHLPAPMRHGISATEMSREDIELTRRVTDLLRLHNGNVSAVARDMGKAPIQVRRWCSRLGIEINRFRN